MRKIALLTCSIICLVVLLSCVKCWSDIGVNTEFNLPVIDGRYCRPMISGNWVVALRHKQNYSGVLCINLTDNQIFEVYKGQAYWSTISGTTVTLLGCTDNVDSLKSLKGEDSKILNSLIIFDLSTWHYSAPTISTRAAWHTTISGKYIAYEHRSRIYLLDMTTGFLRQISSDEPLYSIPEIGGDYVVYREKKTNTEWHIICYQISTGRQFNVTEDASLGDNWGVTDGNNIVWWSKNGVVVYNTATSNSFEIPQGSYPDVDNGIVVYLKKVDSQQRVFATEIATGKEYQISKGTADEGPSIDNGRVVWCDKGQAYCAVLDLKVKEKPLAPKDAPMTIN